MNEPLPLAAAAVRLRRKPGRPALSAEERERRDKERRQRREAAMAALDPRLLSVPAAARYLGGVHPDAVRALVANGVLPRVCIPSGADTDIRRVLIDRADLDRLISLWKDGGERLPSLK